MPGSKYDFYEETDADKELWDQFSEFLTHTSFLIPDTVAFNNLLPYFTSSANKSNFSIQEVEMVGYEAYFVEQWISLRNNHNVIITYTGNEKNRITAYHVQSLLNSNSVSDKKNVSPFDSWPAEFVSYLFNQLKSEYFVATETKLGCAFITNFAQLDPFLTLINAKTGKILDDYKLYVVNHNLRKIGCGSRSTLTIDEPSKAIEDKFTSAFKINNKISIDYAVVDLVLITQTCLYLFDLIDPIYCDGLFCDKTELAINFWWKIITDVPIAHEVIRIKPPNANVADSIQAIIGFTVLCRYLLELGGNTFGVSKDPMDVIKMQSAITKFQKNFKLKITCKFNLPTLIKLIDWAQNNKSSQSLTKDLSKMKILVKNTVIDITSGKNLHSIAHNASASPFHLQSRSHSNTHSDHDQNQMINCQNVDQIRHMSLGKQLNYLCYGGGKQIDLQKNSLSSISIKEIAQNTDKNMKKMKSQSSLQSMLNQKKYTGSKSLTAEKDYNSVAEKYKSNFIGNEIYGNKSKANNLINHKNTDNNDISAKIKESCNPELAHGALSSDDELINSYNTNDEIEAYHPKVNSISSANLSNGKYTASRNGSFGVKSRVNSLKSFEDNYIGYDGDYMQEMKNIDVIVSDEDEDEDEDGKLIYSDPESFNRPKSSFTSRRNTETKDRFLKDYNEMKDQLIPPRLSAQLEDSPSKMHDSTKTHSKNSSRNKLLSRGSSYNDNESDGVYEYEHGFDYDYELDGHQNHNMHYLSHDNNNHSRQQSYSVPRRPLVIYPSDNNHNVDYNYIDTNIGITNNSSKNDIIDNNFSTIDYDYVNFMKRLKRRHSIPLVQSEMNQYSIEMSMKKTDKTLERGLSCNSNRRRGISNGIFADENIKDEIEGSDEPINITREKSIFGSQSLNTNCSLETSYASANSTVIYHMQKWCTPKNRSLSFSSLEDETSKYNKLKSITDITIGSDINLITPETLAMRYLKLKLNYQTGIIQKYFSAKKDIHLYYKYVIERTNQDKNPSTCVSLKYNSTNNDVNKVIGKYYELEDKLKNTVKSNARLKYELRLLLQKTKEVENNLTSLKSFKIKNLQSRIDNLAKQLEKSGEFSPKLKTLFQNSDTLPKNTDYIRSTSATPITDRIYSDDKDIEWEKINWKYIVQKPYVLVYLFFHLILCVILRRVDAKMVEERWKRIDKDQTVTMIIRELFTKSEHELQKPESHEMESKKTK